MFDAAPPQDTTEQAVLKKLRPETEIVSPLPDSTKTGKNSISFHDALNDFKDDIHMSINITPSLSIEGNYNPSGRVSLSVPGIDVVNWSDAGFVGDYETRKDLEKIYSETFVDILPNWLVHPLAKYDVQTHGKNVLRMGLATKKVKVGERASFKVDYSPWSDSRDEKGRTEKELIIKGKYDITDDVSLYGMLRNFSHSYREKGRNVRLLGAQYEIVVDDDGSMNVFIEYRDWPMEGGRRKIPYLGIRFNGGLF